MSRFLPFQVKWRRDNSRLKIWEKARQVGATWTEAYTKVCQTCASDNAIDSLISSRDEDLAKEFILHCKRWSDVLSVTAKDLGLVVLDQSKDISAYALQFANGHKILALSSNPDAQAGRAAHRTLDEIALHPNGKHLYEIAYGGIRWGGSLAIFSTHRGQENFFNKLILEARLNGNPKRFSVHRVTLQDALEQGLLDKLKEKLKEKPDDPIHAMDNQVYFDFVRSGYPDESSFLQEEMCVPESDADAFLQYELIDTCLYASGEKWETDLKDAKNPMFIGVDVGRKKDLTVIWVCELTGDVMYTRKVIELFKTPFSTQEAILYPLIALPQTRRCCIDATGMGIQFAERAQQTHGAFRVEAVQMTNQVKQDLAYPVKEAFEKRRTRIPDDPKIKADLHSVKKETTAANNIRFAGNADDSHADRFWAKALCLHAGKNMQHAPYANATARGRFQSTRF